MYHFKNLGTQNTSATPVVCQSVITDFTVKKRIERPNKRTEMTPTLWMNRSQGDTDLDYKIIQ
jgi:hypothetical protein